MSERAKRLALPAVIHYTSITAEEGRSLGFDESELSEFDWSENLDILEATLRELGVEPHRLGHGPDLVRRIMNASPRLIWNLNSGLVGLNREAQVPAVCEILGIPLVGSGCWTAFVTQDKTLAVEWVRGRGVPVDVVEGILVSQPQDVSLIEELPFPSRYIVKPNNEDSSRGIEREAIQVEPRALRQHALGILQEWGPVRIERYIDGFDVSANLACQPDGTLIALEPLLIRSPIGIYTGTMKCDCEEAPAKRRTVLREYDSQLAARVKKIALLLGKVFHFRHYARFDLRFETGTGRLYFLESNLCPSFYPDDDYVVAALETGLEFSELIATILSAAWADALAGRHYQETPRKVRKRIEEALTRARNGAHLS